MNWMLLFALLDAPCRVVAVQQNAVRVACADRTVLARPAEPLALNQTVRLVVQDWRFYAYPTQ